MWKLSVFMFLITINFSYSYAKNNSILVGTTGDYPPLTYVVDDTYQGTDIEIIQKFAKANHITIKFVPTTWSNLNHDLSSGKFDVAVGGIMDNPSRKKLFYLSDAIESSTKVPLIKCRDIKRFSSFASIDNEGVIIAENRGGTNQEFALQHIKFGTIVLYPKNFSSLDSITASEFSSDVMFTDNTEAEYRHKINPELCIAPIREKFPSNNKVFMFAKTSRGYKLVKLFNSWWVKSNDKMVF